MNKPWSFTVDKKCMPSSNETPQNTSRKFEALAEFDKAKHAIWKITQLGIADKEEIAVYHAFLAEIGIRATAQAQKLLIISNSGNQKGETGGKRKCKLTPETEQ